MLAGKGSILFVVLQHSSLTRSACLLTRSTRLSTPSTGLSNLCICLSTSRTYLAVYLFTHSTRSNIYLSVLSSGTISEKSNQHSQRKVQMCVGFAPKNDSFASFWERQDVFLKKRSVTFKFYLHSNFMQKIKRR